MSQHYCVSTVFVECAVDIAVGFDVTRRPSGPALFSGQGQLKRKLPQIIRQISSLDNICCLLDNMVKPKIAFRLVDKNGAMLEHFAFAEYNSDIVKKVTDWTTNEGTFFNVQLLESFEKVFRQSEAKVKVSNHLQSVHGKDLPHRIVSSYKTLDVFSTCTPQKAC